MILPGRLASSEWHLVQPAVDEWFMIGWWGLVWGDGRGQAAGGGTVLGSGGGYQVTVIEVPDG